MSELSMKQLICQLYGLFVLNCVIGFGCNAEERKENKGIVADETNEEVAAIRKTLKKRQSKTLNIDRVKTVNEGKMLDKTWADYWDARLKKIISFDYPMSKSESAKLSILDGKILDDTKNLRAFVERCMESKVATGDSVTRFCNKEEIERLKHNIDDCEKKREILMIKIRDRQSFNGTEKEKPLRKLGKLETNEELNSDVPE